VALSFEGRPLCDDNQVADKIKRQKPIPVARALVAKVVAGSTSSPERTALKSFRCKGGSCRTITWLRWFHGKPEVVQLNLGEFFIQNLSKVRWP
jgi:hypothetical protein